MLFNAFFEEKLTALFSFKKQFFPMVGSFHKEEWDSTSKTENEPLWQWELKMLLHCWMLKGDKGLYKISSQNRSAKYGD